MFLNKAHHAVASPQTACACDCVCVCVCVCARAHAWESVLEHPSVYFLIIQYYFMLYPIPCNLEMRLSVAILKLINDIETIFTTHVGGGFRG